MAMAPLPGEVSKIGGPPGLPGPVAKNIPTPNVPQITKEATRSPGAFQVTGKSTDKSEAPSSNAKVMGCNQGQIRLVPNVDFVLASPAPDGTWFPERYAPNTE